MAQRAKQSSPKGGSSSRGRKRRQSPELAGGAGFTFADEAAVIYLSALLAESTAPGLDPYTATHVALEQREFGEPMDDLVVDGATSAGVKCRLSLQAKSSLTISAARTNTDFREIIRDAWLTFKKADFRKGIDRFGAVTANVALQSSRALLSLCEMARSSPTSSSFEKRFAAAANESIRTVRDTIETLLAEVASPDTPDIHAFLRHFVLIRLDVLHEGATSLEAWNAARLALAPETSDQAASLIDHLRVLARQGAGRSAGFERADLMVALAPRFSLVGSHRLRPALEQLRTLASRAAEEIEDTVGGVRVARPTLNNKLGEELSRNRFVQIHGLPGTGKSVLLRRSVEDAAASGAAIFLKSDRLEGIGWAGYAARQGVGQLPLSDLLIEIGARGNPTIFIDGLDRVDRGHRSIVLDLVREILGDQRLSGWKIVATVRDAGIEPLRTWLPKTVFDGGIGNVSVGPLDDNEASALAEANQSLRPLLFGPPAVREIARRPFFAKIIAQAFASGRTTQEETLRSEVDLAEGWWLGGGYDTSGRDALERQRALIDLAHARAQRLDSPISLNALSPETLEAIDSLKNDGILRNVLAGHSVQFTQDIFFEWAFLHRLIDLGDHWQTGLVEAGEPPVLGRVVELVSQSTFTDFDQWTVTLRNLEQSGLRTQWIRAWLLGPLALPDFTQSADRFAALLSEDNYQRFRMTLVWFQAERTSPNIGVLEGATSGDMTAENRLLAADLLGWPSDLNTWARFINFVDYRVDALPGWLIADVISIFEVWQNALADVGNAVSKRIVLRASEWLIELEENDKRGTRRNPLPPPWRGIEKGRGELRTRLRQIIFRAGRAFPDKLGSYLQRMLANGRMREDVFKQLATFAPVLSETHPDLLADITAMQLRRELPDDRVARHRKEQRESTALRDKIRAKPEAERTRDDELVLSSAFHSIGFQSFNWHDWDKLSIEDDFFYFPASPLREPFHSLFENAPATALRLTRELSNHAMQAWRQLHRLDPDRGGTPIPIKMAFPWGEQPFWGTTREYLWARGIWAPKALGSAYLALDAWARHELDRGREADEIIREIVLGNECVAALGAAVVVALRAWAVTDVTRPLLRCPRLWRADLQRLVQESEFRSSSQIGFWPKDRQHALAVETLNTDGVRNRELRQLVAIDVLQSATDQSNSIADAAAAFAEDLPFEYEEELANPGLRAALERAAAVDVEWFRTENYHVVESPHQEGDRAFAFVNPQAQTEEAQARFAESQRHLNAFALYHWAERSFENGIADTSMSVDAAVLLARSFDHPNAFVEDSNGHPQGSMEQGAVAATAAAVLAFAPTENESVTWARDVIRRVNDMVESAEQMWIAEAVIPWHPSIFAARAAAAELRRGEQRQENASRLLRLVAHPLETVSLEAISLVLGLWRSETRLAWCGLSLAFAICHLPPRNEMMRGYGRTPHSIVAARAGNVADALTAWRTPDSWPDLALPPPAWLEIGSQEEIDERNRATTSSTGLKDDFGEREWNSDENPRWREPLAIWDDRFASKLVAKIPVAEATAADETKGRLTTAASGFLRWTMEKLAPSWEDPPGRRPNDANLFEWTHSFAAFLGQLAGNIDRDLVDREFLQRICKLRDDACFALLSQLVDRFICAHVLDSTEISPVAAGLLDQSLNRLLQIRELQPDSYRAGELFGSDVPTLARALMFVAVERAMGAARFVNGDWREIDFILPTVDRFVRKAGWAAVIMNHFLTLCERARESFPAMHFADDVLEVLTKSSDSLAGWHSSLVPARIAVLIQHFSERDAPLRLDLARKLLRILDALIDMGDRRSAALQTSTAFRDVRLPAQ